MAPDQVARLALQLSGDRLQHRLGMIAPAALDLIQLAAVDGDGVRKLRLRQAPMLAPFANVVWWGGLIVSHLLAPELSRRRNVDRTPKRLKDGLVEGFPQAGMGGNDTGDILEHGAHLQRLGEGGREFRNVLADGLDTQ
jgi:hypothetical protein